MAACDVLGLGENSLDSIYVVDGLPRPGGKLRILSRDTACGGQVATTMAACASLGLRAAYAGTVGRDESGERIRAALAARGIDVTRLQITDAATRSAVILVDRSTGERLVLWDRDPRLDLRPDIDAGSLVRGCRVVHVDATDVRAAIAVARAARHAGATVTCDVDAVTPASLDLISHVSVPILAEHVPCDITGLTGVEPALRAMRRSHPGLLIVTLGERGAAALDTGGRFVHAPAVVVEAVDTTSAGDVFRAGVIYALLQDWPVDRTLTFANAAAAVSCTRPGAIDSVPRLDEVMRLA